MSTVNFKKYHNAFCLLFPLVALLAMQSVPVIGQEKSGVAILLVDTDREMGSVKEGVYGQFLEHINHSVVDGLYAEQIRGQGFEGEDFQTYWKTIGDGVSIVDLAFKNGQKSVSLSKESGIQQGRIFLEEATAYDGSIWVKPISNDAELQLSLLDNKGEVLHRSTLKATGKEWQEVSFNFKVQKTDKQAVFELKAGDDVLVDFISLMITEARSGGMLRPDLLQSLKQLDPSFLRWPGGSFASIYKWKDGIGPQVSRKYNPNTHWGGYSDYYGFGTDEFLELCRQLGSEPMIVLKATSTDPEEVQYAMDWVHYLIDPPGTVWGQKRAENGHPEPYDIPYFQIDNEPMNHGLSPDEYAEIVNVYGSKLREIAPNSEIVACGQKRSNDMIWSQKMVDIAGKNFDVLGCHNYEYEPENVQTGVKRIENYLVKLKDYIRNSDYPDIKPTVLEWGLCRSYDWRAGLHAAGSLISYEKLGLDMTCPALLMRNVEDDPTWTAFIYHDHATWFPGAGHTVEKLFREHYTPVYLAATSGTFRDEPDRSVFFDDISQMKAADWTLGTVDAIATKSDDGSKMVIKAVNYSGENQTLLTRLQGSQVPENAVVNQYTIQADLLAKASLESPDNIKPMMQTIAYSSDLQVELAPYAVVVLEIVSE